MNRFMYTQADIYEHNVCVFVCEGGGKKEEWIKKYSLVFHVLLHAGNYNL